jgi:uncharacterized protein
MMMTLALAVFVAMAQRPEMPTPPVLVVTGTADVLAVPDEAVVRLGILRQAAVAQTAQDQANAVAQDILTAITKVGVAAKDIRTERLILSPVYNSRSADQKVVSYNATNTVSIRLDNLALTGSVIDAGLKAGANQLNGVQFRLRNELPSRQEALKRAVQEARAKAQAMAEALNVGLMEVLEASESGVAVSPRLDSVAFSRAAPQSVETPVLPGEIEIHANVTIRYRISQKP